MAIRFLSQFRVIRRLVDRRNASLDSEPQPDGTNIRSRYLRSAWVLHRAWIRSLHYRSLSLGSEDFGFGQIETINQIVTTFLMFEVRNHDWEPPIAQANSGWLQPFQDLYSTIDEALDRIGRSIQEERRRPPPGRVAYDLEETVAYNIAPERFRPLIQRVSPSFLSCSQNWLITCSS